ncbi:hypothetical protein AXG93_406s1600 [Marchantia polymorpha subsp. ruderalis]|uniref:Uncharacterized protein n=1 Tax=Marchantia polymorpha subsp. ruderalis TaxID=1480154 RepID=A0A176VCV1_MARPO|nr:hypothetical protein AXG93_406s1600 [Marchantia polymorpha subsp. ruderalis]
MCLILVRSRVLRSSSSSPVDVPDGAENGEKWTQAPHCQAKPRPAVVKEDEAGHAGGRAGRQRGRRGRPTGLVSKGRAGQDRQAQPLAQAPEKTLSRRRATPETLCMLLLMAMGPLVLAWHELWDWAGLGLGLRTWCSTLI